MRVPVKISAPRGSGKTAILLSAANADHKSVFIVRSQAEAANIKHVPYCDRLPVYSLSSVPFLAGKDIAIYADNIMPEEFPAYIRPYVAAYTTTEGEQA